MTRKTAGVLIGGGLGAGAAWLLAKYLLERGVTKVPITLKYDGTCGVHPVPDVEISGFFGPLQWVITNPSRGGCPNVTVKIANWKRDGESSDPPVIGLGRFEKEVAAGHHKTIPAAGFPAMPYGEYKYDILIDDHIVLDPVIKLVP
jgi:hypothetical protein